MIESFMEFFADVNKIFLSMKEKIFDDREKYFAMWTWMKCKTDDING
jgi:hypothetical protein